jgi:hypothetical protein
MRSLVAALALSVSVTTLAHANSLTINTTIPQGTYDLFDNYIGDSGTFTTSIGTFSGDGVVFPATNITSTAVPTGGGTAYMAVDGSETLTLNAPTTNFSLIWGSADDYNSLSYGAFTIGGTTIETYLGGRWNSLVDITATTPFKQITFTSTLPSFEFSLLGSAAPETSTWLMMLLGFIGLSVPATMHRRATQRIRGV